MSNIVEIKGQVADNQSLPASANQDSLETQATQVAQSRMMRGLGYVGSVAGTVISYVPGVSYMFSRPVKAERVMDESPLAAEKQTARQAIQEDQLPVIDSEMQKAAEVFYNKFLT